MKLDDGTILWLNKRSSVRIPDTFSATNRRVLLEGEVYLDVQKNPHYPFLIETSHLNVKVLGTSFNLNTGDGNKVETILVAGRVMLEDKNNHSLLEMSPGENVTFMPENSEYLIETVDTNTTTAWHLDQLTFENVTLREIVNKLEILYDVNVKLPSTRLAQRRFRCVVNREENLADILNQLRYIASVDYRIEGREVFIYE